MASAPAEEDATPPSAAGRIEAGSTVTLKGTSLHGTVESLSPDGKGAFAIFGNVRMKVLVADLSLSGADTRTDSPVQRGSQGIYDTRTEVKQDLDLRGLTGDEALPLVDKFIDTAVLAGASPRRHHSWERNGGPQEKDFRISLGTSPGPIIPPRRMERRWSRSNHRRASGRVTYENDHEDPDCQPGEIAVRVMRTCREMGIRTVAVFSEADRSMPHVLMADEAYFVGAAPSRDSYLRMDRILEAAATSGAEAIHPGYGFLAENEEFAQAVADAGLIFIGPTPQSIRTMGDKTEARKVVSKAGVPIVPGTIEPLESEEEAKSFCAEQGFPVLIKAAAGGGGKGMRIVRRAEDFPSLFRSARSEAQSSFGTGGSTSRNTSTTRAILSFKSSRTPAVIPFIWASGVLNPAATSKSDRGNSQCDCGRTAQEGDGGDRSERGARVRLRQCRDDRIPCGPGPAFLFSRDEYPTSGGTSDH